MDTRQDPRSPHDSRWAQLSVDGIPNSFDEKERVCQLAHQLTPRDQKHIEKGQQYMVPKYDFGPTGAYVCDFRTVCKWRTDDMAGWEVAES